jgi:iron complex outermembrane receptor protein
LNGEKDFQFTQEARIASKQAARLTENLSLKWQIGEFAFTQRYDQTAINNFAPGVFDIGAVAQVSPVSRLNDLGYSVFGQATVDYRERVDLVATVRGDREIKKADTFTGANPSNFLFPPTALTARRTYENISPNFAAVFHLDRGATAYASIGKGFKAGGFNPVSPAGGETYNQETAWHIETGAKANFLDGRATASASWYFINWNDLQYFEPVPSAFNQFYVLNIGGARSKGAEFEIKARPLAGIDFFAIWGVNRARFDNGTTLNAADVSGNLIPNSPKHTFTWGTDVARNVRKGWTAYGHFDTRFSGSFMYDGGNSGGQAPYSLTSLSAGLRGRKALFELWVKNASNTRYIPVAFASDPLFAPSGFLGEMGAPRRYGFKAGLDF